MIEEASSAPLLSLRNAVIRYGGLTAVDGVSFDLHSGETLGLVGESGCGKSSIARALSGLTPLAGGELRLDGRIVTTGGGADRRFVSDRLQLLFQDPAASLSPRMTVLNLLTEPLKIRGIDKPETRTAAIGLLADMGLGEAFLTRYPHQLSGGQARRVALARALTASPRIIVADEPTAGLDVSIQGEILNILHSLRERLALSYLLISHNLDVVGRVADRLAVMYLGRIVEIGGTTALFRRPSHPYTRVLLSSNLSIDPDRRGRRTVLKGEVPSPSRPPPGCHFHQRCPSAQARCALEVPRLARRPDGRLVACHFPLDLGVQAMAG